MANREILACEGLHWNGRSAGWCGRVIPDAVQRLRDVFPDRVEAPSDTKSSAVLAEDEANGPAIEVGVEAPRIAPPDVPPVNMAGAVVPTTQPAVSAAKRLPTSPSRAPLLRRPSPT
ncbi:hypothetical protein N2603_05315 [Bradyrhizobium huanghuaihaiense]|uniref:hypothetical protein n=1 Tax=Bradyrhizobium huanghuaihaiense TaxID=990078 RepID=UPI0021AA40AB|nr:hypothetical protein [Bradyrhizobium sp. CB3035]UWU77887.1 hypothetical protein N2603_05315 [Bradyrhizobium sp. CB3035]